VNLLSVLDNFAASPECVAQNAFHETKTRNRIASLREEAAVLREEAAEMEEKARQIESATRKVDPALPALAARWMLAHLPVSPFVAERLEVSAQTGDVRVPRAVALLYGIALPSDFFPPIPSRERIARGNMDGLEMFAGPLEIRP
jgi:hypothetical protein